MQEDAETYFARQQRFAQRSNRHCCCFRCRLLWWSSAFVVLSLLTISCLLLSLRLLEFCSCHLADFGAVSWPLSRFCLIAMLLFYFYYFDRPLFDRLLSLTHNGQCQQWKFDVNKLMSSKFHCWCFQLHHHRLVFCCHRVIIAGH
jgi:hypothetical protein